MIIEKVVTLSQFFFFYFFFVNSNSSFTRSNKASFIDLFHLFFHILFSSQEIYIFFFQIPFLSQILSWLTTIAENYDFMISDDFFFFALCSMLKKPFL